MIEIRRYITATGKDIFGEWLRSLKDNHAKARILARITRLQVGNFGDCKTLRHGVAELRVDWGPGYRIYYSKTGNTVVLLLCGGDKRKQDADIKRAVTYLEDYKKRTK